MELEMRSIFLVFYREHEKKLHREYAWRRVQERAAVAAKAMGNTAKYDELISLATGRFIVDEIEYVEDVSMDEASFPPTERSWSHPNIPSCSTKVCTSC